MEKTVMKVLVFGSNGQLGFEVMKKLEAKGMAPLGFDLPVLDITDNESVLSVITLNKPDCVVNASAYTLVDKAETEWETAFKVNRDGPCYIARACAMEHISLIHVSTDYVFDGQKNEPYRVDDIPAPLGVYGLSKEAGEQEVRKNMNEHIIIRTSWLYGGHGQNFVKTIMRLADERDVIRVVNDQYGSPTYAVDLADAITEIIDAIRTHTGPVWGTYHYTGKGVTTWYDFAQEIVELARRWKKLAVKEVKPISSSEYPTLVKRPMYSVLDCSHIESRFNISTKPWRESLERMLKVAEI
jgi:dTDP-4-dehydrorhamnose reductase